MTSHTATLPSIGLLLGAIWEMSVEMIGKYALLCLVAGTVLFAFPASAQTAQQRAEMKTNELAAQGRDYFNRGESAAASGDNTAACSLFKGAAAAWQNANWANIGMLTEIGQNGQYDKDVVLANGQALGRNSQLADARAKAVCGKPDAVSSAPAYSSSPSSSAGVSPRYVRPDMSAQVAALQTTINAGYGFAQTAVVRYGARDTAGSCANANNAAAKYKQAQSDARAILKASGSYADIAVLDLRAIDANAAKAEVEAQKFYCRPVVIAPRFAAEIAAFMTMKSELHLDRGAPTPLSSARALAGRKACTTDRLFAAIEAGSEMATAINDGCQAFVFMYNMNRPSNACSALVDAGASLGRADPVYAVQAKPFRQGLDEVSRAFKCPAPRAASNASPGFEEPSDLKEVAPNLPPQKLITKPYPARPALPVG